MLTVQMEHGGRLELPSSPYQSGTLPVELTEHYVFPTTSIVEVQILLPHLLRASLRPEKSPRGMQGNRSGTPQNRHVRLFRRSVGLPVVAVMASCNKVVPNRESTLRPGDNVVQGQLHRRECIPAILTPIVVPNEDVFPRQPLRSVRHLAVLLQ